MVATLDGIPFDVDPHTVTWDYRVHIADRPYLGGKVIQVHGATIGDITITGQFGSGVLLDQQLGLLDRVKRIGNRRLEQLRSPNIKFSWPEQRWDMDVIVVGFGSLEHEVGQISPNWQITMTPVTGTDSLKSAAVSNFIDSLANGMGWRPGKYNGGTPEEIQALMAATGSSNFQQYVQKAFGIGTGSATGSSAASSTASGYPTTGTLSFEQVTRIAANAGFVNTDLRIAVAIARAESSFRPDALGDSDQSIGLWQIYTVVWGDRFGTKDELKIPERNASGAYQIYRSRNQTFTAWSTYTNGAYLQYLDDAKATADRMGL